MMMAIAWNKLSHDQSLHENESSYKLLCYLINRRYVAAAGANLGYDCQIVLIGMQGLADNLIGDVRPVEVARVYVVHTRFDCLTQHCHCGAPILRGAEHARACQLHRAIAQALDFAVAKNERTAFIQASHIGYSRFAFCCAKGAASF